MITKVVSDSNAELGLGLCRRILALPGQVLILFPEGTRSPDGEPGPFKPGIGALVAGSSTPVVPCWIEGAHRAFPKGAWWPRPWRLELRIGEARSFEAVPDSREGAERVAADLRRAVTELGGRMAPQA